MKGNTFFHKKYCLFWIVIIFCIIFASGCKGGGVAQKDQSGPAGEQAVVFSGNGMVKETRMTMKEMLEVPEARYEHVYSAINNWPTKKKYAARGVKLAALLEAAGLKDEARCLTVKGKDGFEWSFTREQLLGTKRYYFPGVLAGDPAGAEPVEPIIAYEYLENSDNLSEARADDLCLIVPQANVNEQTNYAFVKGVGEIVAAVEDPGRWPVAAVFPPEGKIAGGDTVKLQHKDLGLVKMYYTLDGSTPTENSTLYNPSTYQPELNKPIRIDQDTTIKVLVKGFGKHDSDIAEFHYQVRQGG
ncbi:chitobiase/beta-hexosaminidase C-terminal domain-containing protein [Pelotomaculum isophthalicicum JI]|uniref:Chitobiase/beta-hexosaminidase C-terminal domain-containing protein n=1 Tax=Pelotomaculum isophthalicicum JI TaxID=947010 RepID=A0A9X4H8K7_9FIRM|nr:chitobiase/beta-hexosaminidase C-terminal domain-containing protein [Pelotomaculum isophthalicicum]MDF9409019.1 chitobiase/beta-hexosaminidase C-terminal domain-containing protein [Pelotomaculum isophthalicicum JI]